MCPRRVTRVGFYIDPSDSSRPVLRLDSGEQGVLDVELVYPHRKSAIQRHLIHVAEMFLQTTVAGGAPLVERLSMV